MADYGQDMGDTGSGGITGSSGEAVGGHLHCLYTGNIGLVGCAVTNIQIMFKGEGLRVGEVQ